MRDVITPVDQVERRRCSNFCRLNARGNFIFELGCGCLSVKRFNAAGNCASTLGASL